MRAVECANDQERFWDYHDTLYTNQRGENLRRFAEALAELTASVLGLTAWWLFTGGER